MKQYFFIILFLLVVCSTIVFVLSSDAQADTIRYVKEGGAGDGTSWATASGTLQAMIDNTGTPCQIWVASGTYSPTVTHGGTSSRHLSFQMKNGVEIYGGFSNMGSPTWAERDWELQKTVLSGEIGNPGTKADNCYHVFCNSNDLNETAVLDGFTITSGNANGNAIHSRGGGMLNGYKSNNFPTIRNCLFFSNSANVGGGIYSDSYLPVIINNCIFQSNYAYYDGGGIYSRDSSNISVTNCTFVSNICDVNGGGIYCEIYSESTIINCTFLNNSAANSGGGIYISEATADIINCTFNGNYAGGAGGAVYYHADIMELQKRIGTITNCILWGNNAGWEGDEIYDDVFYWGDDPTVSVTYSDVQNGGDEQWFGFGTGCFDAHPQWVNPGSGDFHLQSTSPCIDAGTNTAPNLPTQDFEGDDRIIDGNASGTPTVDMGVDEYGVKVGVYVTLQGDNRPIEGWKVPLTLGLFEPGADVLTATPIYSFTGTTTMVVNGTTRAYFECPYSIAPGTYDMTADTLTTLMNVKRLVGIW